MLSGRPAACLRLAALAVLLLCAGAPPADARSEGTLGSKLQAVRSQLVELARAVRQQESYVARAEQRLADLRERQDDRELQFEKMRGRLSGLAMALQRLARRVPAAVMATPHSPLDSARALSLISFMTPEIKARTDALGAEVAELDTLRRDISRERARLDVAKMELRKQRARLDWLIGHKNITQQLERARSGVPYVAGPDIRETVRTLDELYAALREAAGQQRAALKQLRVLLARVPDAPGAPPGPAGPDSARSAAGDTGPRTDVPRPARLTIPEIPNTGEAVKERFTFPVAGSIVLQFGMADGPHSRSEGISVAVRPGSRVVAPNDGTVVFADEFRGYGRMVIIEHEGGFHTMLSPLSRVDVRAQQVVFAGEPVGVVGTPARPDAHEADRRHAGDRVHEADRLQEADRLYVELRRDGTPVDPLSWLPVGKDTVIR